MCSKDRLDIDLSICTWMSSIRFTVNFLFDFYEKVFFKKLSKFQSDEKVKEYDHQIRHKKTVHKIFIRPTLNFSWWKNSMLKLISRFSQN